MRLFDTHMKNAFSVLLLAILFVFLCYGLVLFSGLFSVHLQR